MSRRCKCAAEAPGPATAAGGGVGGQPESPTSGIPLGQRAAPVVWMAAGASTAPNADSGTLRRATGAVDGGRCSAATAATPVPDDAVPPPSPAASSAARPARAASPTLEERITEAVRVAVAAAMTTGGPVPRGEGSRRNRHRRCRGGGRGNRRAGSGGRNQRTFNFY
ncbi:uncharacterized protein [Neodiprion pinetum]|uniref:uncharacterized protein n=1 Tax=Neodiprion pinetum TaxID=441929 RepID=UPI001EDF0470|nr:translation initiation factor IF-2-like [Neodiprion pinetum]